MIGSRVTVGSDFTLLCINQSLAFICDHCVVSGANKASSGWTVVLVKKLVGRAAECRQLVRAGSEGMLTH